MMFKKHQKVNPPLATIRAEAAQLGFYAVMDGVLSLRGEIPAEFTTLVDIDFIKRDSAAKVGYLEERLYRQIVNYTKSDKDKIVNILMEYIFNNNHSIFIIEGEAENNGAAVVDSYRSINPSVESVTIPHTRHLPHMEDPEKFLEQIGIFL